MLVPDVGKINIILSFLSIVLAVAAFWGLLDATCYIKGILTLKGRLIIALEQKMR